MKIPFSIIAVFIDDKLSLRGNTAAIVDLEYHLSDDTMQQLAADFNQPATTFLWREDTKIVVRWFAPDAEIKLCGHGSLAAFAYLDPKEETSLTYNNGVISGRKTGEHSYCISLSPILSSHEEEPDPAIIDGLNTQIKGYYSNNNKNIILLENENAVRDLKPNFSILKNMEPFGIIVTAPGDEVDFVSRTFVPKVQQLEDPATGSSHAALTPFWAERLDKVEMTAIQLSSRGGKLNCHLKNGRVEVSGQAKTIATGVLT